MTPRQAYTDTANRAMRMLRLHDGLINTRSRRIRNDWRESFCRLMRWRLDTAIERVDSKDAILILRPEAGLATSDFTSDALDDLLRSALTFAVSALDRYVHELVVKNVISALKQSELNGRQEQLTIPAAMAIRLAQNVAATARAGNATRPSNEVRKAIQEELHRIPFQSWRDIEYAFHLIGVGGLAGRLQAQYGVGDFRPIRDQLNRIVERRNHIVHEGDLVRHQRGGHIRSSPISRKYVEDSMNFLDDMVDKMDTMIYGAA